ncbi:MAG: response regulator [Methylacidiphilales bacterium]|nr:response regulator [Candidatus Methylacidiphilales bacterium]
MEDNSHDREHISGILNREFSNIHVTHIHDEAILHSTLKSFHPDVVLTDYNLGWSNGISILRIVREIHPDCPVIMVTGTGSESVAVDGLKHGLDDYFIKTPGHLTRLGASVRKCVEQTRHKRLLRIQQRALSSISEGVVITDPSLPDNPIIYVNDAFERISGYPAPEVIGKNCRFLQGPGSDPEMLSRMRESIKARRHFSGEILNYSKQGVPYWNRLSFSPVKDEAGNTTHFVGVASDISTRKQAEENLLEQKAVLNLILDSLNEAVIAMDMAGRVVLLNPWAKTFFGTGGDSAECPEWLQDWEFFDPTDNSPLSALRHPMVRAMSGETFHNLEIITRHGASSREHRLSIDGGALRDKDGSIRGCVLVCRDISAERQMEEHLRQSQKMETIGQLAGGVAHDFNNILVAILGYSELLLNETTSGDPRHKLVEEIYKAAGRAATLTRQLLTFSRKHVLEMRPLSLNKIATEMEDMLRRLIGERIRFVFTLCRNPDPVLADAGQIEQIIMNLVVNARDAMPSGGTLEILTRNVTIEPANSDEIPAGNYVCLSVSDTGMGMTPDVKEQIFEPFFTTKGQTGTGLGLSTCRSIIRQMQGQIRVYTEVGKGSIFRIYLPATRLAPQQEQDAPLIQPAIPRGTETVLLVDDEASLRLILATILKQAGYQAVVAANGREALDYLRENPEVHVVVTDVMLPDMPGTELASKVKELNPSAHLIFTSGYASEDLPTGRFPSSVFIQKPFTPTSFMKKLRQTLDTTG